MSGHKGTVGYEIANQLEKLGSKCLFIGLEPACGFSVRVGKKAVREWTNRDHKKTGNL
jgi:hypothetical protein